MVRLPESMHFPGSTKQINLEFHFSRNNYSVLVPIWIFTHPLLSQNTSSDPLWCDLNLICDFEIFYYWIIENFVLIINGMNSKLLINMFLLVSDYQFVLSYYFQLCLCLKPSVVVLEMFSHGDYRWIKHFDILHLPGEFDWKRFY